MIQLQNTQKYFPRQSLQRLAFMKVSKKIKNFLLRGYRRPFPVGTNEGEKIFAKHPPKQEGKFRVSEGAMSPDVP